MRIKSAVLPLFSITADEWITVHNKDQEADEMAPSSSLHDDTTHLALEH